MSNPADSPLPFQAGFGGERPVGADLEQITGLHNDIIRAHNLLWYGHPHGSYEAGHWTLETGEGTLDTDHHKNVAYLRVKPRTREGFSPHEIRIELLDIGHVIEVFHRYMIDRCFVEQKRTYSLGQGDDDGFYIISSRKTTHNRFGTVLDIREQSDKKPLLLGHVSEVLCLVNSIAKLREESENVRLPKSPIGLGSKITQAVGWLAGKFSRPDA